MFSKILLKNLIEKKPQFIIRVEYSLSHLVFVTWCTSKHEAKPTWLVAIVFRVEKECQLDRHGIKCMDVTLLVLEVKCHIYPERVIQKACFVSCFKFQRANIRLPSAPSQGKPR